LITSDTTTQAHTENHGERCQSLANHAEKSGAFRRDVPDPIQRCLQLTDDAAGAKEQRQDTRRSTPSGCRLACWHLPIKLECVSAVGPTNVAI
jgi:hypothetical protein